MPRYVITFPVGGPLADHYLELEATDELSARLAIIGVYGQRGWASIYVDNEETRTGLKAYRLTKVLLGTHREDAQDYAP